MPHPLSKIEMELFGSNWISTRVASASHALATNSDSTAAAFEYRFLPRESTVAMSTVSVYLSFIILIPLFLFHCDDLACDCLAEHGRHRVADKPPDVREHERVRESLQA